MRLLIVVFAFLLSGCVSEISTLTARGDVNGVQQELAKGVDKASLNEALCRASESGHYQLAKLLIEKGADSNQKDCHIIKTPLCGVFYGDNGASYGHEHASIVELLVKNGAEINGPVCINDTHLITRFLMMSRHSQNPYAFAQGGGQGAFGQGLLQQVSSANQTQQQNDHKGKTPHLRTLEFLVENGLDLKADITDDFPIVTRSQIGADIITPQVYARHQKLGLSHRPLPANMVDYISNIDQIVADKREQAHQKKLAEIEEQKHQQNLQRLFKQQSCHLKYSDWIYIDQNCSGKQAHGEGRAVYIDGQHSFKGTLKNGEFVAGVYLKNGKPEYDGQFSDGQPHGKGVCFYNGEPEECKYYKGKRIDALYKQRQEIESLKQQQQQELAKLRGEMQQLKTQTHRGGASGGSDLTDKVIDSAIDQGMRKVFDHLF